MLPSSSWRQRNSIIWKENWRKKISKRNWNGNIKACEAGTRVTDVEVELQQGHGRAAEASATSSLGLFEMKDEFRDSPKEQGRRRHPQRPWRRPKRLKMITPSLSGGIVGHGTDDWPGCRKAFSRQMIRFSEGLSTSGRFESYAMTTSPMVSAPLSVQATSRLFLRFTAKERQHRPEGECPSLPRMVDKFCECGELGGIHFRIPHRGSRMVWHTAEVNV